MLDSHDIDRVEAGINTEKFINPDMALIFRKLVRIETVLLGVPGTDSKGLVHEITIINARCESHTKLIAQAVQENATLKARCDERCLIAKPGSNGNIPGGAMGPTEGPGDSTEAPKNNRGKVKKAGIITGILSGVAAIIYAVIELCKVLANRPPPGGG
jgi:hypothetical protein